MRAGGCGHGCDGERRDGRAAGGGEIVLFSFFLDLIYFSRYVGAYGDRGSWAWAWRAGMELWKVHNFWARDGKNK
jgi:hypothetical protein